MPTHKYKAMHPLENFRYCPLCGSSHFESNSEKSKKCENCGFEYFQNPSAANVAFIINDKNELLVERRKNEPAKGMLDLPGGFCDIGETVEEGVIREVKEETGLTIKDPRYLFSLPNIYIHSDMEIYTLDMFFFYKVEGEPEIKAMDDAAECKWVPIDEIRTEQFGLRSVRQGLLMFIEKMKIMI